MSQTIIITGASSGIGKAAAKFFAQKGWTVAATMRNTDKADDLGNTPNISVYQLDVNDDNSVKQAINKIHGDFGQIDALVNNAGYAELGVFESHSMQDYKNQFETNFFGILRTTLEVLPIMRSQGKGSIVNITSYAGVVALPLVSVYGATKWAVDGFSNSLRLEVEEFGINVSVVIPGYTRTNLTTAESVSRLVENCPKGYENLVSRVSQKMTGISELSEPEIVAETIHRAVTDEKPLPRYAATPDAQMMIDLKNQKSDVELEQFFRDTMIG